MRSELDHIRKRLRNEGDKTIIFFEGLSPADWDCEIYSTGSRWRAREVLAHFISAERAYQRYLQEVLKGGVGATADLDIDQFNETDVATMDGVSPRKLLDTYRLVREDTIDLTKVMEEEDLAKIVQHPWFGSKEISWYLKLLYRHNTMHRQDVQRTLHAGKLFLSSDDHRTVRKIDPQS